MLERIRNSSRSSIVVAALALATAACSDQIQAPSTPDRPMQNKTESPYQDRVEFIAKGIAQALDQEPLRVRLRDDLRESRRTREHKLFLKDYLSTNEQLIHAAAQSLSITGDELRAKVAELPQMEMYLPVRSQRESWTPERTLSVVVQIDEVDIPIAYASNGERSVLSLSEPPTYPVLSLVPAESYSKAPLEGVLVNRGADGSVGTWSQSSSAQAGLRTADSPKTLGVSRLNGDCDPEIHEYCDPEEPGMPGSVTYPPGLYLDYSSITDLKETWPKGDPEIQLFVIGPTYHPTSDGERISCSGEGVWGSKEFDQNGHTWGSPWWVVKGMILSKAEVDSLRVIYNAGVAIHLWEDDDASCVINTDERPTLWAFADYVRSAARATSILIQIVTSNVLVSPATIIGFRQAAFDAFLTRDDLLGLVVYTPSSRLTYPTYETATAALETPSGSNGSVRLRTVY